jgi:hypothetical protein
VATELKTDCRSLDAELDAQWGRPDAALSAEARRHIEGCPRCRALYQSLCVDAPATGRGVAPAVQRSISEEIRKSLTPVKPQASTGMLAAQVAAAFLVISVVLSSMMKLVGIPVMNGVQMAGMSAVLALGLVVASRSLAWQMTPGSRQTIPAWNAVAILVLGLLIGMLVLFPMRTPQAFLARGLHCLRVGVMIAVPSAVLFWFMARRGAPLNLTTLGATLGALAGLVSVALLQVACDLQEMNHLVVWHGGVLLLTTLAGAGVGRLLGERSVLPKK